MGARYDNTKLHDILVQHFGTMTFKDLTKKVLIPTFNLHAENPDRWEPVFMHNMDSTYDSLSVVDAAMRTSAAPSYFELHDTYGDGGLCNNNPVTTAISQAVNSGVALSDIAAISVGTGKSYSFISGKNLDWGALHWALPLINILLDSGDPVADIQGQQLLKEKYLRINPDFPSGIKIALDDYSRSAELIKIAQDVDLQFATDWINTYWKD